MAEEGAQGGADGGQDNGQGGGEGGQPGGDGSAALLNGQGGQGGEGEGSQQGDGGQSNIPDWFASLETDVRDRLAGKNWKTPNDMGRSYIELESKIAAKGVIPPGEKATDEERAAFYDQLGRPKDAAAYEFALPDGRDPTEIEKAFHEALRPALHKAGLTQAQLAIVNEGWNAFQVDQANAAKAGAEQAMTELRREWGGDAEAKFAQAQDAWKTFGPGDEVLDQLDAIAGAANVLRFLQKVGAAMDEAGAMPGGGGNPNDPLRSPAAARAEIERLTKDEDFQKKFTDNQHAEYADLVAHMQRLHEVAGRGSQ